MAAWDSLDLPKNISLAPLIPPSLINSLLKNRLMFFIWKAFALGLHTPNNCPFKLKNHLPSSPQVLAIIFKVSCCFCLIKPPPPHTFTAKLDQIHRYQNNQYKRDFLALNTNLLTKPEQLLLLLLTTDRQFIFQHTKEHSFISFVLSLLIEEAYAENLISSLYVLFPHSSSLTDQLLTSFLQITGRIQQERQAQSRTEGRGDLRGKRNITPQLHRLAILTV